MCIFSKIIHHEQLQCNCHRHIVILRISKSATFMSQIASDFGASFSVGIFSCRRPQRKKLGIEAQPGYPTRDIIIHPLLHQLRNSPQVGYFHPRDLEYSPLVGDFYPRNHEYNPLVGYFYPCSHEYNPSEGYFLASCREYSPQLGDFHNTSRKSGPPVGYFSNHHRGNIFE